MGKLENAKSEGITKKSLNNPIPIRRKTVVWNNKEVDTPVYSTGDLTYGHKINGPTIIESSTSTIVVPENYLVDIDKVGNLEVIRRNENE